jgi:prepilin-type N-terminal cleavage/methylation domain-containing protein
MTRTRDRNGNRSAFTLIELLVVIAIIGVLASFLLMAVSRAQFSARKAHCMNNLTQFAKAIQTYRIAYDGNPPPWLSNLYPQYVSNWKMFLCPQDPKNGRDGGKPYWENDPSKAYPETDDFEGSDAGSHDAEAAAVQNPDIKGNSYLYEFCAAECSWYDESYAWQGHTATRKEVDVIPDRIHSYPCVTWREIKQWEVTYVGPWTPIVRCFWHTGGTFLQQDYVLNIGAEDYHYYLSGTGGDDWKKDGNK